MVSMAEEEDPITKGLTQDTWSEPLFASDSGEYALNPTGNDEDGWDYGDASPDDDLDNADWPKGTPDTQEALAAAIYANSPKTLFIAGQRGWFAWFDIEVMDWASDTEGAPLKMIREGFGEAKMNEYIESDKTRRELYDDVVAFLAGWGVKASVVD